MLTYIVIQFASQQQDGGRREVEPHVSFGTTRTANPVYLDNK